MAKLKVKVKLHSTDGATRARGNFVTHNLKHLAIPSVSGHKSVDKFRVHELYFLSDQKLKVGDWALTSPDGSNKKVPVKVTEENGVQNGYCKIVATTNPDVEVPPIPYSFMCKYVEKAGQIDEVYISAHKVYAEWDEDEMYEFELVPQTRLTDSTVIVSKTKENFNMIELRDFFEHVEAEYSEISPSGLSMAFTKWQQQKDEN